MPSNINPPTKSTGDKVHQVIRAGLGLLPIGSGTAVEIFNALVTPPLEKRKEIWMSAITEALQKLEDRKILTIDDVFNNEKFITILVEASSIAIRNHDKEKLEALKNVVIHTALDPDIDDAIQSIVLRTISNCSGAHLYLLKRKSEVSNNDIEYNELIPMYEQDKTKWDTVINDLSNLSLIGAYGSDGLSDLAHLIIDSISDTEGII